MPLIISVAGRKGGTGKTTISCGLASIWHQQGKRVLVVDLDPQSNAAFALGADPAGTSTTDLILDRANPQKASDRLYVYAGGPSLTEATIQNLHPEDLADLLDQAPVDVVICDCPPGNERLERLGITASSVSLVIADAHPFAAQGAMRIIDELENLSGRGRRGPSRHALIMSRIDSRRRADRKMTNMAEEVMPTLQRFTVHQDAAVANATASQELIAHTVKDSRAVTDMTQIVEWIDHG